MISESINRPRTIIVRFLLYSDRKKVWKASWELKDKVHYVKEDFPDKMKENRKVSLAVLWGARKCPTVKNCSLRGDKLIVNGSQYTADNLEALPENLHWNTKGQLYFPEQDATFFFGEQSILSNFHRSVFTDGKTKYNCVEQCYLQQKSLFFGDEISAHSIMKSEHAQRMKSISHRIKGVDESKWMKSARGVMRKACQMKFTQNADLREKLLKTKGDLVEANGRDCYFSCGLSLSDPNILDKSTWCGENILGQILTQLRNDLNKK